MGDIPGVEKVNLGLVGLGLGITGMFRIQFGRIAFGNFPLGSKCQKK